MEKLIVDVLDLTTMAHMLAEPVYWLAAAVAFHGLCVLIRPAILNSEDQGGE